MNVLIVFFYCRFLFNDNKTSEQVVNVQQQDDSSKKYIPLTYDKEKEPNEPPSVQLIDVRIVPAMTDDSPIIVEEDLDLSKEDIR